MAVVLRLMSPAVTMEAFLVRPLGFVQHPLKMWFLIRPLNCSTR